MILAFLFGASASDRIPEVAIVAEANTEGGRAWGRAACGGYQGAGRFTPAICLRRARRLVRHLPPEPEPEFPICSITGRINQVHYTYITSLLAGNRKAISEEISICYEGAAERSSAAFMRQDKQSFKAGALVATLERGCTKQISSIQKHNSIVWSYDEGGTGEEREIPCRNRFFCYTGIAQEAACVNHHCFC